MKFLIAGLGNVGEEYENTRHNIGFTINDALAEEAGISFELERHAYHSLVRFKGRQLHLIKPTTYVNLSGKAVRYWLNELKITPDRLLVIVDDIALPFGKIRMKGKGGDAGHNGLKDIIEILQTNEWARLRFGIGSDFPRGQQADYVLGQWSAEEQKALPEKIKKATDAIKGFTTLGLERSMNLYN